MASRPPPDPAGTTKVVFRQTGGFAGRILGAELDASELSDDEVSALEWLLGHAGERAGAPAPAPGRDVENYEIRILLSSADLTFAFDGMAVPERVGPLLDRLKRDATPQPLR